MPALLFVYSDPGTAVPDATFNDWADNEHVPLRVAIPGFETWSRWIAADGESPPYTTLYGIASPEVLSSPPYTDLAKTRSERETAIVSKLALLDRRTYTLREPVYPPKNGAAYDPLKPGPYMSVVEIEVKEGAEDEFNKWYDEEHVPMLAKVPGWMRSRRFVLEAAGATGSEAADVGRPPKYLAIHEWESLAALETDELKEAVSTSWMAKLVETAFVEERRRAFKFMRSWDREQGGTPIV
ncbi:uncharacterized protein TRAVEDRAFT_51581 [Trametes versicolor FP-101664 SS1]|uniref:uncharacterized protein n=1 Tax=Trametes versicolor (strain FP-101664) TaxID=717944 RepID=UPI0004623B80|nr:uncharacterized protein TRAVEDRAFT_51581 [Trametes versicolor FP-101664 SS1]EIW53839.1 hypothetical protein TRAVEDRAFT_51581 [Trametes versicolor FP-101664 SS1]